MNNFTSNTYEMKREIMNFCEKISRGVNKPTTKFIKDIESLFGIWKIWFFTVRTIRLYLSN